MPECRTIRHLVGPVPELKKLTMPEQVRYRTKPMQSGIFLVRHWNKIMDATMLMPAFVSLMPMPSYVHQCSASLYYSYSHPSFFRADPPLLLLFATKLMGRRVNECFVSLSCGLFLTCRGEIYMISTRSIFTAHTVLQINTSELVKTKKILHLGVEARRRLQTAGLRALLGRSQPPE
jgi:hypothetical protein